MERIRFPNFHIQVFDPPVPPDDPEKWINEDDFDWDESPTGTRTVSVGYDDDGDCRTDSRTSSQKDTNDNGIECDIELSLTLTGEFRYDSDSFVDEDPDDEAYAKEALHRASILGIGKLGFVFIISIFIPLFMATGLIRDEMTSGTMHYMLTKPIARTEVFFYRVIGYLGIVWPYLIILTLISGISYWFCRTGRFIIPIFRIWHLVSDSFRCYDGYLGLRHAVLFPRCHVAIWDYSCYSIRCLGTRYGTIVYGCS